MCPVLHWFTAASHHRTSDGGRLRFEAQSIHLLARVHHPSILAMTGVAIVGGGGGGAQGGSDADVHAVLVVYEAAEHGSLRDLLDKGT